jgi:16S rRNA (adenine1518-N6/adenine1519-N6)-dimethyltransferase
VPGYRAKKRFGQNFLKSEDIIARIVDLIHPAAGMSIVEVGAGRGALSLVLAQADVKLTAIEIDRDLTGYLTKLLKPYPQAEIVSTDFLKWEPESDESFTLVGNLPFNITSPVIEWLVWHRQSIDRAVLLIQRELAARLSSGPGGRDWSPLSILTQLHFDIKYHFEVGPKNFHPAPEVTSAVIEMLPRGDAGNKPPRGLERVVRAAFAQRRKLLVNNLSSAFSLAPSDIRNVLREIGLNDQCRAEQVTIEQFLQLTESLVGHRMFRE